MVTDTVWVAADVPGTLSKARESGAIAIPGSAAAKPVRVADALPPELDTDKVPVLLPAVFGLKLTATRQDAVYASVPVQGWPPKGWADKTKSPVTAAPPSETVFPPLLRLVTLNMTDPLALLTGTDPKSCARGVRSKLVAGSPCPVRFKVYAAPPMAEVRVKVPGCAPATVGRNWMAR